MEMMTKVGVRTIAVGGRPEAGPMQASGSRGAIAYSAAQLDSDFFDASRILSVSNTTNADSATLWPLVTARNPGMRINRAGITLRDQVVSAEDPKPLQLKYQAADCRIYWTLDNVLNFTRLWADAATAMWDDQSLCVAKSTGYTTRGDEPLPKHRLRGYSKPPLHYQWLLASTSTRARKSYLSAKGLTGPNIDIRLNVTHPKSTTVISAVLVCRACI
jgi:hypothetical protein